MAKSKPDLKKPLLEKPVTGEGRGKQSNIGLYVMFCFLFLLLIGVIVGLYFYEQEKLEEAKEEFNEELSKMGARIEIDEQIIEQNRVNNIERLDSIDTLSGVITSMQLDIDEQSEKITAVETEINDIEIEIDENAEAAMDQLGTIENKVDEQGNQIGSILILSSDSLGNENSILPGYSLGTLRNLAIMYVSALKHFIYGDRAAYNFYDPDPELRRIEEEIIPESEVRLTWVNLGRTAYSPREERRTLSYNREHMRKLIAKECYYMGECDNEGPGEYGYYEDRERIEGLRVRWAGDPNIPLILAAAVGTSNNDILNLADPPLNPSYSPLNSSYIEDFKVTHDIFHDWCISDNPRPDAASGPVWRNPDLKAFLTDLFTNNKTIAYRVFLECILCHMYQSEGRREKEGAKGATNSKTGSWLRDIEPMDFRILHLDPRQVDRRRSTIPDFRRYDDDPSVRMYWDEYKDRILYSN